MTGVLRADERAQEPAPALDGETAAEAPRRPRAAFVVVSFVFAAALAAVVVNLVANPAFGPRKYSMTAVTVTAVVILVALPFVFALSGRIERWFGRRSLRANRAGVAGVTVVSFVVLVGIGMTTLRSPGFDAGVVFGSAQNLALGHGLNAHETLYYSMYPNNLFLTLALGKSFALVHAVAHVSGPPAVFLALAVAGNAVMLALGVLFTFLVARRLAGRQVAVFTLLFSVVFVVLSPWIGTVYSDTLGLVFPVLVVWFLLRAEGAGSTGARLAWWGAIGLTTAVGYELKPTTVFPFIAVALVVLIRTPVRRLGARALLKPIASILVALVVLGVAHVGLGRAEDRSGAVPFSLAHDTTAFPLTHFLKMGSHGTGGYDAADVQNTYSVPTESGKFTNGLDGYVSNVERQGPGGYANFLANKTLRFLGDGTFYQWQEGNQLSLPFIVKNSAGKAVQSVYGPTGSLHPALVDLWQAMWLVLLVLGAVPLVLFRDRRLFSDPAVAMRVALLGLIVFLMLFEGRSRYVYLYVPFFVLLAGLSMRSIVDRLPARFRSSTGDNGGRPASPQLGPRSGIDRATESREASSPAVG